MTDSLVSELICSLESGNLPDSHMLEYFLQHSCLEEREIVRKKSLQKRREIFGNKIYIRGLLEFTSFCKNDCYYCGLRKTKNQNRYRLSPDQIIQCCKNAYRAGFRTFVLQGGEDLGFSDHLLCNTVYSIKENMPDCAITLSVGERPDHVYRDFFSAGAERYLLRHETADSLHYSRLHPRHQLFESRMRCLNSLKEIGFQTGAGFMVGSPGQTAAHIVKDIQFIYRFNPEMTGIGPFIPATGTPFAAERAGSAQLTALILSIIRIMKPKMLLPSTTAMATAESQSSSESGHRTGIMAGANVIMPNISPYHARKNYLLYDGKKSNGSESFGGLNELKNEINSLGFTIPVSRGDHPDFTEVRRR